ncbi:unnamed protein product, partial [Laminaria digitata]
SSSSGRGRGAVMKTLHFLALAIMLFCDRAYGYSLKVTACNLTYGGTPDDDIK